MCFGQGLEETSTNTRYAHFRSGRALTPQESFFLSSTDNVPFGGTSRVKGYSYFSAPIISVCDKKRKRLNGLPRIFFSAFRKIKHMGLIIIRTVVIFATLFVVMRLMGKRQIGEMQPYELVITLIISELACIPMEDTSIPLLYGVISILTVYLLHQIVCIVDLNFRGAKAVLSGSPSIVLNKNGIDDTQLKKNNLDVSDLIESLRVEGYFSLDAVDYAMYESEGTFSALPKKDYQDMQASLPVILVDEGKFDEKNVAITKRSKEYYFDVLREQGCVDVKKILVMTVDGNGKVYLQEKGKKYKVFHLNWKEKLW